MENVERRRPHGGEPIRIGLCGCGTVGGGVLRLLKANEAYFSARVGVPLSVRKILVRDLAKSRVPECDRALLTDKADELLDDPSIDLVVEVMGGERDAGDAIERALARGASVVTANKALLAKRGRELLELASRKGADLAFEAAVGGGIPIVRTLRDAFASDRVTEIVGILNGTSNYILSEMAERKMAFNAALSEAQRLGYAEADPTLDVGGGDAAQKLIVLAMLAFGTHAETSAALVEGIDRIDARDLGHFDRFGFVVRPLVVGRDHGDAVELRAHPALVKRSSVFANIGGVQNAIKLHGEALGPCWLSGRGAGDMPTAVSVVADILDVARSIVAGVPGLVTRGRNLGARPIVASRDLRLRYYLRLSVFDRPGVLGRVASELGNRNVSLAEIVQEPRDEGRADVTIVTHVASEGAVRDALGALEQDGMFASPYALVRIEET
jgi:homoserine dehydrogenase